MKKRISTSELGSMMIEALAMLALIATITPVLYRKTAERTTELQDINTAGEIRSIIKAVDDYVSANYDAISQGQTVTNSCPGTNASFNYSSFSGATDAHVTVPIGHFCEFLPYGILDSSGNAKQSRLFSSDYQIALKLKGSNGTDGDKVITAFVVTDPNRDIKELRASSIASMIGGNGGYVVEEGENKKINGNLGIWGVDNPESELGVTSIKKGAIVAASIQGISSQNAKIDLEGVLYRKQRLDDPDLNTMSTTLYMGAQGSEGNDISNVKNLIIGGRDANGASLYIDSGSFKIGDAATIDDDGNITISGGIQADGDIGTTSNLTALSGDFSVADDALQYGNLLYAGGTNQGRVLEVASNKVQATQPLAVTVNNDCGTDNPSDCALYVAGSGYFGNNLTIQNAFSASNLHGRDRLTVGGPNPTDSKALDVTYTNDATSSLDFGNGVFQLNKAAGGNTLNFDNFMTADSTAKTLGVSNATHILMTTDSDVHGNNAQFEMQNNYAELYLGGSYLQMHTDGGMFLYGNDLIQAYAKSIDIESDNVTIDDTYGTNGANISATVAAFALTPSGSANTFKVVSDGTTGKAEINGLNTYITGTSDSAKSNVIMKNSNFYLKNNSNSDIVRIGETAGTAQVDISGQKVTMKDAENGVLKIDITKDSTSNEGYPVYIRKGAIELTQANAAGNLINNYVKADRFVVSTTDNPPLYGYNHGLQSNIGTNYPYQVNPAYTSLMHDIKLTTRGGARLSDILPDFINKGIYVVDNTYPALGTSCTGGGNGMSLASYMDLGMNAKNGRTPCTSLYDQVSPWAGFVPTPACPPGYSKVITLTPASFAMAQAGIPQAGIREIGSGGQMSRLNEDLLIPLEVKSPYDYLTGSTETDPAPTPLYYQKNTWLKSFINKNGSGADFVGWDVGMGFVYPYYQYQDYIEKIAGTSYNPLNSTALDNTGETLAQTVIWNLFPVYAGTLEGYATVYCYFNRSNFESPYVDTTYNQLDNFRDYFNKQNYNYYRRLNSADTNSDYGTW